MDQNRRHSPRFTLDSIAEVMVRGFTIEFPTRNISEGGACLDSLGVTQFRPGDMCYLLLAGDEEVPCEVVEITRTMLRLKFLDGGASEVLKHFVLKGEDEAELRPVMGSL